MACWLLRVFALAAVVVASGWLANLAARPLSIEVPIWPPAGIALAACLVCGRRLWPGVFVGAFLNYLIQLPDYAPHLDTGEAATCLSVLAAAYTAQAVLGTWLVRRRLGPDPELLTVGAILYFLAVAGPVHTTLAATVGTGLLCASGVTPWAEFGPTWVEWWWSDVVGGVVFAVLTLTLIGRPADVWRRRRWTVGLPLALAAVLLCLGFAAARRADDRQATDRLAEAADRTAAVLTAQLAALGTGLDGLRAGYKLHHCWVDRSGWVGVRQGMGVFRATNPAVRNTGVVTFVPGGRRAAFETEMRTVPGSERFQITELGDDGRPRRAADRDRYAPVLYVEPLGDNPAAVGLDSLAEPASRAAVLRAEATGWLSATAPVRLAQRPGGAPAIVLFQPLFADADGRVVGFVATVLDREKLVREATGGRAADIVFDLAHLATEPRPPAPPGGASAAVCFGFGGQAWEVRAAAGPGFVAAHRGRSAPLVGAAGCGLALLLAALLLTVTGQTGLVRAEVAARTAELEQEASAHQFTTSWLLASQRRLAEAQQAARIGSWEWDPVSDDVTGTPTLDRLLAHPPTARRTLAEFLSAFHPDDRQLVEATARAAEPSGPPAEFEARVVRPDGEVRWTACTVSVSGRGIEAAVCGTVQDITDRKAAEARNQVHNLTARLLAEATELGQAMPAVLEAVCQAAGWSVGEFWQPDPTGEVLRRTHAWTLPHLAGFLSAGRPPAFAPGEGVPGRVWATGRPLRLTDLSDPDQFARSAEVTAFGLRTAVGFPVLADGRTTGVFTFLSERPHAGTAADINLLRAVGEQLVGWAERTAARERLKLSEERFRALLDRSYDVVAVIDRSGRFLYLSPALARLTGIPAADEPFGNIHPDDVLTVRAALADCFVHPDKVVRVELRTRKADGGWLWLEAIGSNQSANPAVGGVVVNARDITERKRSEEERRRYADALQQTQRMESLGALAGGVAHDFNNLLTGVLGNASLAREMIPEDSELHEYLAPIERAAEQAAQLCQQMLAYSGRGGAAREVVDLNRLIEESGDLLRLAAGKRTTIKVVPGAGLPLFEAEPGQLRQVILNLVQNAAEAYAPGTGLVIIRTGTTQGGGGAERGEHLADPPSAVPPPPSEVWLEVEDYGAGMDDATRGRMFEPFFTTKFTGRGLGLSAVHGIVRRHGGDIRVTTAPGRGTTVRVSLPVGVTAAEPAAEWSASTDADRADRPTILVADDEPYVRELAAQTVRRLGYEVEMADDGAAAVELMAAAPERYAAALLDVTMPAMSGPDALSEMRRVRPDLPAVFMSGYTADDLGGLPADLGVRFLAKPFRPSELTKCVQAAVRG